MRGVRTWTWLAVVVLAVGLAACGGAAEKGVGQGVVREIRAAESQVTLEHGDIPGVMKGMTMTFDVADPSLLQGLSVGEHVSFHVEYAGGHYTVDRIERK